MRVYEIQTDDAVRRPLKDRRVKLARGKRAEHRVVRLYTPILLNNAPFDFIFGVDKL